MGSSGHGPALLSPAPGRCTDISSRDNFWSEREIARDRPGPEENRGPPGNVDFDGGVAGNTLII